LTSLTHKDLQFRTQTVPLGQQKGLKQRASEINETTRDKPETGQETPEVIYMGGGYAMKRESLKWSQTPIK